MSTTVTETRTVVPAGTWAADPVHSSVEFTIRHMRIVPVRGRFLEFEARLRGGERPQLHGSIRVASAITHDEQRDAHLQSPDFLDAERYPEATLESVSFEDDRVVADLTLHGVTRPVEFRAEVLGPDQDPWGNDRIGLLLEGEIDRTDFGVSWNAPLPGGGLLLDDAVTLTAQLSLVRRED